jgi:hypothetical protein
VVRRVRRAGCDVEKERPVRRDALHLAHPGDGLVGEVFGQVVIRVGRGGDEVAVLVEDRVPVVHVAGVEAVEVVEPEPVGPAVERAGGTGLPRRSVVVLADPSGHVAILAQHLADGAAASWQHARVPVVAGCGFGNDSGGGGVVVPAGDERRACWAAERRRMEAVVPQSLVGELLDGRRRDAAAKSAVLSESGVVKQDQHDVRRALRRLSRLRELRFVRVEDRPADAPIELKIRRWQHERRAGVFRFGPRVSGLLPLSKRVAQSSRRGQPAEERANRENGRGRQRRSCSYHAVSPDKSGNGPNVGNRARECRPRWRMRWRLDARSSSPSNANAIVDRVTEGVHRK